MGTVTVIGEPALTRGYILAGAQVPDAGNAEDLHRAWHALAPDTSLVILTATAAQLLGEQLGTTPFLTVVMPT